MLCATSPVCAIGPSVFVEMLYRLCVTKATTTYLHLTSSQAVNTQLAQECGCGSQMCNCIHDLTPSQDNI